MGISSFRHAQAVSLGFLLAIGSRGFSFTAVLSYLCSFVLTGENLVPKPSHEVEASFGATEESG